MDSTSTNTPPQKFPPYDSDEKFNELDYSRLSPSERLREEHLDKVFHEIFDRK